MGDQPKRRSSKADKRQSNEKILEIQQELLKRNGQPAILFVKESRDFVPYFITLHGNTALHRCFGTKGELRCCLKHQVSPIDLLIGHQQIIFFDDI